jgi:two-component system, cell cycle sensor histidine kinase and response regulator CckA
LFAKLSHDISLVLLDTVMPKMGGHEIFKELKEIDPQVKVVVTSGLAAYGGMEGVVGFLKKPYHKEELIGIVGRATARG